MLSVIICSRSPEISKLEVNIQATVGIDYELIVIDNSSNQYSIFQAYNIGIERSKFKYLCFIHDDVRIHTVGWGKKIIELFSENSQIGLLGVAGSKVKTKIPSGWWDCDEEDKYLNIIQHFNDGKSEKQNMGFEADSLKEAVVIDGVFMVLRKDITVRFNEKFPGFHGYDLALSFEVIRKGFKIGITNSILIEHFSFGIQNGAWLNSIIRIHQYYKKDLALSLDSKNLNKQEIKNCTEIMKKCLNLGMKKWFFYYWLELFYLKPVSKFHFKFVKNIINLK